MKHVTPSQLSEGEQVMPEGGAVRTGQVGWLDDAMGGRERCRDREKGSEGEKEKG